MKSNLVHQFSQIPRANIPRSRFARPSSYKTTLDSGFLVPFFLDIALPSDTFSLTSKFLLRITSPLIAPVMDNLFADVFYFAVPFRLLWDNWERFCGERRTPDDVYDGVLPKLRIAKSDDNVQSLADYFGIPVNNLADGYSFEVNALPFRAYNLVFNEWFRDENLVEPSYIYTGDSTEDFEPLGHHAIRRRGKRHDYATSCLPWPQKGPDGVISIGGTAPVYGDGNALGFSIKLTGGSFEDAALRTVASSGTIQHYTTDITRVSLPRANGAPLPTITPTGNAITGAALGISTDGAKSGLLADLSAVNPIPINDFRQAVALQHWFEALARGGSRYTEIVRSVFGTVSPDARLQRPEYLGGGSFPIDFKTVEQTSSTDGTTPQGNLAAFGLGGDVLGFTKSFTEHCLVIGLISIRADLTYQQGLHRFWQMDTLESLYWPQFAHLGEQAVLSSEIYADGTADDGAIFGYQERYAEWRYKPSRITGKLNSRFAQPLDAWHLAQDFAERPVLNEDFISEHPPLERVVAVTSEPQFLMDSFHDLVCARPMPLYGVPGLDRM